ncbi:MAG: hypothetical protein JWP65_3124 [Ramlibacter sp.]|jgi:hypothetical protein|uniref:hypothetical protein n=1 Tax=Ramlibacter sp. TaxID=1917967 RepID=UPI00261C49EF|nr:hypothetical protein [Ramlibacter sp.]MDB5752703.1 hypothetical protein [Ramlibacter sp.]
MAGADALRGLLLGLTLAGAAVSQAQVPAQRSADPAASLMPPAGTAATVPPPAPAAGRWTAAQVQQSFSQADSNADGQLTRAEAQRLALLPRSFEDMDANKDGVLSLAEYQAGAQ